MLGGPVRRLLLVAPTLIGVTLVTFLILETAPGDPARLPLQPGFDQEAVEANLRAFLGLDRPLAERYLRWLSSALTLDFGRSFSDGEPVSAKLAQALPPSLFLGGTSLLLGLLLSIPLGIYSAARAGRPSDRILSGFLLALYSIPPWVTGLVLILLFGVWLEWLPFQGWRSFDAQELALFPRGLDVLRHSALILLATLLPTLAHDTRFVRQAMAEELRQGYVAAARSLGIPERRILWNHALRNALVPIFTLIGLSLPGVLAGSVLLEQIFAWPGMGRLFFTALERRDYPLIMGITTLGAFLVVMGTLIADLLALLADPRLRHGRD